MIRSPHNTFVVIHTEPPFWFSDQHLFWFSESYPIDDVIGCEEVVTGWFWRTEVTRVWLIEHGPSNSLLKRSIIVSGDLRKRFQHDLTEKTTTGKIKKNLYFVMMIHVFVEFIEYHLALTVIKNLQKRSVPNECWLWSTQLAAMVLPGKISEILWNQCLDFQGYLWIQSVCEHYFPSWRFLEK